MTEAPNSANVRPGFGGSDPPFIYFDDAATLCVFTWYGTSRIGFPLL